METSRTRRKFPSPSSKPTQPEQCRRLARHKTRMHNHQRAPKQIQNAEHRALPILAKEFAVSARTEGSACLASSGCQFCSLPIRVLYKHYMCILLHCFPMTRTADGAAAVQKLLSGFTGHPQREPGSRSL